MEQASGLCKGENTVVTRLETPRVPLCMSSLSKQQLVRWSRDQRCHRSRRVRSGHPARHVDADALMLLWSDDMHRPALPAPAQS